MGRKQKGRSVRRNKNQHSEPEEFVQAPHSFVIHRGLPGGHTLELTKDIRKVMEPFTATSLKERKKNTIKDFIAVAGPLHVSHLSIVSRTELGMYLKTMRLPRGPTLTFKIHNFSLARDVVSSLKKQNVVEEAFKHSPLIVLNSFSGEGLHMKMMASMFQNMFPTINLTSVDLNTVRRCVMLNYNTATKLIDFRHYNIKVVPVGISKGVKKVVQGKVPNLSRFQDITDFFTKAGNLSESEVEEDPQNQVVLAQKISSRGNMESGKSAIRLTELGPRLTLQLIKIEDGLLDGEVLYHEIVHKTEEEKLEIAKKREMKKKLKEKRKKIQEINKKVKDEAKQQHKEKSLKGMNREKSESDVQKEKESKETNEVEDDDTEYFRQEVGEEPDKDLFQAKSGVKRKFQPPPYMAKKFKRNEDAQKQDKNYNKKNNFKKSRDSESKEDRFHRTKKRDKVNSQSRNKKSREGGSKEDRFHRTKKRDKVNFQSRDYRPIGGKMDNKNKGRAGKK